MLRYFKSYHGMVISLVMALIISLCMSVAAFLRTPGISFSAELLIRNWGAAFLSVTIVSLLFPVKAWGDRLAGVLKLKKDMQIFGLIANLVPTFFFNTVLTVVEVGINIPDGFASPNFWTAIAHDFLPMFAISYVLSLVAERIGISIARKVCSDT